MMGGTAPPPKRQPGLSLPPCREKNAIGILALNGVGAEVGNILAMIRALHIRSPTNK